MSGRQLAADFTFGPTKLPLYAGRLHFLRRVRADKTVSVLNVAWPVRAARPDDGVWVTIELTPGYAALSIYDKAPDVLTRTCLARQPFPLSDTVLPFPSQLADALLQPQSPGHAAT